MSVNDQLCWAARDNKPDDIRRLLKQPGADVNAQAFRGWRPIHFAALTNKLECAEVLLAAGADPYTHKSSFGENAYNMGNDEIKALCVKYAGAPKGVAPAAAAAAAAPKPAVVQASGGQQKEADKLAQHLERVQIQGPQKSTSPVDASPAAIQKWIAVFGGSDYDAMDVALDALKKIGAPATPLLLEALVADKAYTRSQSASVLGSIRPIDPRTSSALEKLLKDKDNNTRWCACNSLGELGKEAAYSLPALAQVSTADTHGPTRQAASSAIAAISAASGY